MGIPLPCVLEPGRSPSHIVPAGKTPSEETLRRLLRELTGGPWVPDCTQGLRRKRGAGAKMHKFFGGAPRPPPTKKAPATPASQAVAAAQRASAIQEIEARSQTRRQRLLERRKARDSGQVYHRARVLSAKQLQDRETASERNGQKVLHANRRREQALNRPLSLRLLQSWAALAVHAHFISGLRAAKQGAAIVHSLANPRAAAAATIVKHMWPYIEKWKHRRLELNIRETRASHICLTFLRQVILRGVVTKLRGAIREVRARILRAQRKLHQWTTVRRHRLMLLQLQWDRVVTMLREDFAQLQQSEPSHRLRNRLIWGHVPLYLPGAHFPGLEWPRELQVELLDYYEQEPNQESPRVIARGPRAQDGSPDPLRRKKQQRPGPPLTAYLTKYLHDHYPAKPTQCVSQDLVASGSDCQSVDAYNLQSDVQELTARKDPFHVRAREKRRLLTADYLARWREHQLTFRVYWRSKGQMGAALAAMGDGRPASPASEPAGEWASDLTDLAVGSPVRAASQLTSGARGPLTRAGLPTQASITLQSACALSPRPRRPPQSPGTPASCGQSNWLPPRAAESPLGLQTAPVTGRPVTRPPMTRRARRNQAPAPTSPSCCSPTRRVQWGCDGFTCSPVPDAGVKSPSRSSPCSSTAAFKHMRSVGSCQALNSAEIAMPAPQESGQSKEADRVRAGVEELRRALQCLRKPRFKYLLDQQQMAALVLKHLVVCKM
mmetsp:Transcript_137227/g.238635  ORF Transcript_137227/g.238635 Transcript_137227/m.238635 type:complete len:722 (-) Transcript_137227:65-2230(-)